MKYKVCPDCGAHLDFGERCACGGEKPICPLFRGRVNRGQDHLILCLRDDGAVAASMRYESRERRDEVYRGRCCGHPLECALRTMSMAIPRDPTGAGSAALARLLEEAAT